MFESNSNEKYMGSLTSQTLTPAFLCL